MNLKISRFEENNTIAKQIKRGEKGHSLSITDTFLNENRISIDLTYLFDAKCDNPIKKTDLETLIPRVIEANRMLKDGEGDILDNNIPMTGWQNLPEKITEEHLKEINDITYDLSQKIDAFVSMGIGGSYLGIEATIRALTHNYFNQLSRVQRGGAPEIYFLGQNMDPDYFRDTLDMLSGKRVGVNVISKSGTTTETAVAFRIIQQLLEIHLGNQASEYIIATTDRSKGALKSLADKKGYKTFVVPENIGGRFSVLSDVGLVGLAMANLDIREFVEGFRAMRVITLKDDFWNNPALVHAAARHAAWQKGKKIEVVATN
jgi:glucose-6-phosphate isomerase